ncbi:MAG: hypothetical protein R3D55_04890 [Chloroflexota bacterium]
MRAFVPVCTAGIFALAQKKPEQALSLEAQIAATDNDFPDTQNVVASAEAMLETKNRQKWRTPLFAVIGLFGLDAVGVWCHAAFRQRGAK